MPYKIQHSKRINKRRIKTSFIYTNACFIAAIESGYLQVVKRMCKNKHPCDISACEKAAEYGHIDILKYLVTKFKLKPNPVSCILAVANGHIDVLRYLICNSTNNILSPDIFTLAAICNDIPMLQLLYDNKCPYYETIYNDIHNVSNKQTLSFISTLHKYTL